MRRKPTRRKVERAIDRLEEGTSADLTRDRGGHKMYAGVNLSRLPGTEAARERAADARTVHLANDRESAETALSDSRVIGWTRRSEAGDGDHPESTESTESGEYE